MYFVACFTRKVNRFSDLAGKLQRAPKNYRQVVRQSIAYNVWKYGFNLKLQFYADSMRINETAIYSRSLQLLINFSTLQTSHYLSLVFPRTFKGRLGRIEAHLLYRHCDNFIIHFFFLNQKMISKNLPR